MADRLEFKKEECDTPWSPPLEIFLQRWLLGHLLPKFEAFRCPIRPTPAIICRMTDSETVEKFLAAVSDDSFGRPFTKFEMHVLKAEFLRLREGS